MTENIINAHKRLLSQWRHKMDLIGPGDMEEHFIDASSAITDLSITGRWIDLGSGAGFPGIALAAYHPHIQVTLLESRQKRAIFLQQVLRDAKISNAQVVCDRTESIINKIQQQHLPHFDGIISRAYKPPLEFLADALLLGTPNCIAISMLGEHGEFVIPSAWQLLHEKTYTISSSGGNRKRWLLKNIST